MYGLNIQIELSLVIYMKPSIDRRDFISFGENSR
jgi:hypothetical protein